MACPLFEKENVRAVLSYRKKIIAKAKMVFFYVPTSKFSSFKMLYASASLLFGTKIL